MAVRKVPTKVVGSLSRDKHPVHQKVGDLPRALAVERAVVLAQIAASWAKQTRRPTAAEIDSWIDVGRP